MDRALFLKEVDCYCTGGGKDGMTVVARAMIEIKSVPYPVYEEVECKDPQDQVEVQALFAIVREKLWERVKDEEWLSENPNITFEPG